MSWVDVIGFVGTFLIAFSFFLKGIVQLRLVSLTGCIIYVFYGFLISSWPVMILNSIISLANSYYLLKEFRDRIKQRNKHS